MSVIQAPGGRVNVLLAMYLDSVFPEFEFSIWKGLSTTGSSQLCINRVFFSHTIQSFFVIR